MISVNLFLGQYLWTLSFIVIVNRRTISLSFDLDNCLNLKCCNITRSCGTVFIDFNYISTWMAVEDWAKIGPCGTIFVVQACIIYPPSI